ncbi:S-adenosylmethionine sensor upstream of mTORC1-like isoform X2 [Symsagittifera roscoffensis]
MHQLASKYWEGGAENCRVEWCYETLKNYFSNSISQHIEKDLRIACFEIDAKSDTSIENEQILSEFKRNLDEFPEKSSCNSIKEVRDSFRSEKDSAKIAQLTKQGGELLFGSAFSKPEFHEAKKLLDVGSCYNPFSQLNDCNLEVVAVDLTPASKSVFKVDFVNISTSLDCSCFDLNEEDLLTCNDERCVKCLPEAAFDVVTFCFLLSYIPSPTERLNFCAKARKVLKFNGLLIITETQSITPHNNLMFMKQWRCEIEQLGFRRICYESKAHIHAMAFRKVPKWLRRCSFVGDDVPKTKLNKKPIYKIQGYLSINQDIHSHIQIQGDDDSRECPKPKSTSVKHGEEQPRKGDDEDEGDRANIPQPPHKKHRAEGRKKGAVKWD